MIAVCEPTDPPTLVLGSSQSELALDPVAKRDSGLVITRRSSGGGAVLVAPGAQIWIDVWLPRPDPLWDDDVIDASYWIGDAWLSALALEGGRDLSVHRGRLEMSRFGDRICFAGLGPGEVLSEDRKLVGLAQRRTREGARFHTVSPVASVSHSLVPLLELSEQEASTVESILQARATSLSEAVSTRDTTRIEDSVVSSLAVAG